MDQQGIKSIVRAANLVRFARPKRDPGRVQESAKPGADDPDAEAGGFPLRAIPG